MGMGSKFGQGEQCCLQLSEDICCLQSRVKIVRGVRGGDFIGTLLHKTLNKYKEFIILRFHIVVIIGAFCILA